MNLYVILVLYTIFSYNPDSIVRGIYINPYQGSKKSYLEYIFKLADSNYINTILVDLKGDYGYLCYETKIPLVRELKAFKRYIDLDYLIKKCKGSNVKLIARIVCFRDSYLAQYEDCAIRDSSGKIWYDKTGTAWVNPYNPKTHKYLIEIIKELEKKGINSFALDYILFPTDSDISSIRLTNVKDARYTPIMEFLKELKKNVKAEIVVCIFGYAVWYDLKHEGQEVSRFGTVVDVVYPMIYPSHFHPSFKKEVSEYWRNYWIYFDSVEEAFKKLPYKVKVIPFVQGFDLYCEEFNDSYIFSQILGALNADADGILIWQAASNYTISLPSLIRAHNSIQYRYAQNSLNIRRRVLLHQYQEIGPTLSLFLMKNQKKNLTSPYLDNQSDIQPLKKIRTMLIPDQIMLW
jgi:hypothetical protein